MKKQRRISALHTAATWAGLPLITGTFGSIAMVTALMGNREIPEWASRTWARWLLALAGVTLEISFDADAATDGHYVLVSNHTSHLDVPCIILAWPGPVRFVTKRSLFAIPVFGQALAAVGHIPVVRGNSDQAKAALQKAIGPLKEWVSVLFFAEGTRSRDGELQRFKKGCLALAEEAGVPLSPVAVVGTHEVLPRGSGLIAPGLVRVHFGAALEGLESAERPRGERIQELRDAVVRAMETTRPSL
ncbi:MAG: lysophospholipid acyltransferase family protein [Deltaproteobacteria bacterium]|nr:lysophospholipid acyltransferase family protein [Deltaproteobacteria bacterium]